MTRGGVHFVFFVCNQKLPPKRPCQNRSRDAVSRSVPEALPRANFEDPDGAEKVLKASQSFKMGHEKVTRRSPRPPKASKEVTSRSREGHEKVTKPPRSFKISHGKVTRRSRDGQESFKQVHEKVTRATQASQNHYKRCHVHQRNRVPSPQSACPTARSLL